ncbi:RFWD2 [Branchiostoma lanceolatum]|uniref:RFWD2 protein n=1 Tax=Branchiostoma lanceolatum TaxID=7740 RepID=A0A8K0ABB3_BRALA|nr:RFWD2 [Branchiostoma lanceolatum]
MAGRTPTRRRLKRPQPPIYNGIINTDEDKNNDFVCPICFDMIEEAHMTKCGHSFCFKCIQQSLEESNRCPKCNFVIEKTDQIFPNFLLNELILKHRQRLEERKRVKLDQPNGIKLTEFQELLSHEDDNLDITDVNLMLEVLYQKKTRLEADSIAAQNQILKEFLQHARRRKQEQLDKLMGEVSVLDQDMQRVQDMMSTHQSKYQHTSLDMSRVLNGHDPPSQATSSDTSSTSLVPVKTEGRTDSPSEGFNVSKNVSRYHWLNSTLASRRTRLDQHFDDLEKCYFSIRLKEFGQTETHSADSLCEFTDSLTKFTKYSGFRPLATLSYASDIYNGSSIVSSIEFDRDNEYFAIAGVTKKIKVFEYGTVIRDAVDIHYPCSEMACNSKISCVCWSSYHKGMLASSDYEGTVTLWDAFMATKSRMFQEHEKRCWSVDFNHVDPKLLASGSDDAKVKLWATNMEHSVACLEAKANVCCVKFNPNSRFHIAFGSADHCVHYYDLRNTRQALNVLKGHRKAVSYAKFVNSQEIVSASTDSQLKLWHVSQSHCTRTFQGHINEKNFVGLASNGDYVACGSENNSLYVYYKGLSKQLITFKFDTVRSVLDKEKKEEDANEFVSAVCFKGNSNVVVAANSQGTIKVLEMI